jgi:hypothetical protein
MQRRACVTLLVVGAMTMVGCGSTLGDPGSCRTYASAYTEMAPMGIPVNVTCTHAENAGGFDRTCTGGLPTIEHWASKADFIDEAGAVGIVRLAAFINSQFETTITYEYDSQRRLQHMESSPPGLDDTFDAWDDLGRPLHRSSHVAYCPGGYDVTITYGDHTITYDAPAEDLCPQHTVHVFDADGIATTVESASGVFSYVTTDRATVCR